MSEADTTEEGWHEWHLTPDGWIEGRTSDPLEPAWPAPADRLLTREYRETHPGRGVARRRWHSATFGCDGDPGVRAVLARCGAHPPGFEFFAT